METISITHSYSVKERILSIDVIRGFALLGILLVNIWQFGVFIHYAQYIDLLDGKTSLTYYIWLFHNILFEGKMRGLFTLLFGAGIILFTARKEEQQLPVADAYFRRMLWLLAFGLIDTYLLLWRGDVLYEYALCGMLLFVFRNLRARYLLIFGIVCLYIYSFKVGQSFATNKKNRNIYLSTQQLIKDGKKLTEKQSESRKAWEDVLKKFPPFDKKNKENFVKDASEEISTMRMDYADMFEKFVPNTVESQSKNFYMYFWEGFGTILIGMALFKLNVFSGGLKRKYYFWMMAIGLLVGFSISWYIAHTKANMQAEYIINVDARPFSIFYAAQFSRIATIIGYIGLFMFICSYPILKKLKHALSCVGRTAITNYLSQTIICTLFFNAYGLGMWGKLQIYQTYIFVFIVWVFQITISVLWLRYFKMGPVEWLWRSLIYKKLIPNKIKNE